MNRDIKFRVWDGFKFYYDALVGHMERKFMRGIL